MSAAFLPHPQVVSPQPPGCQPGHSCTEVLKYQSAPLRQALGRDLCVRRPGVCFFVEIMCENEAAALPLKTGDLGNRMMLSIWVI